MVSTTLFPLQDHMFAVVLPMCIRKSMSPFTVVDALQLHRKSPFVIRFHCQEPRLA